ncbi:MAG TPA: c-type cytochrome [Bryobacteraceae bacterium]|nr:c-type cytochrome [Bryobacteraceae bacterium]
MSDQEKSGTRGTGPQDPQADDPVIHSSLSRPLYLWSAVLVLSLGWGLYDEMYGIRPWKGYEARFEKLYSRYLTELRTPESQREQTIKASPEYRRLDSGLQAAEKAAMPEATAIDQQVNELVPKILALNDPFQEVRSHIGSLTYESETSHSESRKASLATQIQELQAEVHKIKLPGEDETRMNFDQMSKRLQDMKDRKAELLQKRVEVTKQADDLRKQRDKYLADRIAGASLDTINSVQNSLANFDIRIRQIHIKDIDLVDRCESCHLGTREPVEITAANMDGEQVFASHPEPELLKIHDPENFGCTPCHGGNGVAVSSIEKAHGYNEHWLWPLNHKENIYAGCQQCHVKEIVTEMAGPLNDGREIYRLRGCIGCHRYENFDREGDEISSVNQSIHQLEQQKAEWLRDVGFKEQKANNPRTPDAEAKKLFAEANDLRVRTTTIDAKVEQLDMRASELVREVKKVGPSLKEVRMKLRKEWIPVWLEDPHAWREGTKMPTFRLPKEDRQAIAAFIWQSGVQGQLAPQKPGDPEKGREAFETRGCMACHSMGEGSQKEGGTFAANLSREGEKANYDYLVRWVHNPRQRTAPYCPFEKKDLTEDDYKRHGLPYVFDLAHDKCPNDGHELQVQQMTPMPSLRLTEDEARDIASYLMTRKHSNASYADASYMDDPKLKNIGLEKVRFYGCAGCHEIAGLEEEARIGTELTKEGSKPIERLDFALLGHQAEAEGWYTHKGFFEHKLADPAVYDQGKEKAQQDKLKMPNFNFSKPEIDAVTTFLEGSVDATVPARYFYNPTDQRQDIIDGWWVVRKYNCMGCHRVHVAQTTIFDTMRRYQDPDWRDQKPPTLIGEGARVNPEWLMRFLNNPSLSETDTNRDGVRQYLKARMPTFSFSDGEIRKLVRFFEALSAQAEPFIPEKVNPITEQEKVMARQLFSSEGAPCLKCHMTGDPQHDSKATAPNFTVARERLQPGWVKRWILAPAMMAPGTAMPSNLFQRQHDRWVFAGPVPASFNGYTGDHADLLVRYMFNFTPDEIGRLRSSIKGN